MNIDVSALEAVQKEHGIDVGDMLGTIARALLASYLDYPGAVTPNERTKVWVNIDRLTGMVSVHVSELDADGETIDSYDDTPEDPDWASPDVVRGAIVKRLQQIETGSEFDLYKRLRGTMVSGTVTKDVFRNQRGMVVVDLGTAVDPGPEGVISLGEQIPNENLRHGERVLCWVTDVSTTYDGKQLEIALSRSHPELVRALFELEVPEVKAGQVEIVSISREAGHRSKIAVKANVKGVNAKGACIGPKGSRVNAVMEQLSGEKIDIIDWDEDPAKFVANALAPSKVVKVEVVDETAQFVRVTVPDYQLSLAIGKEGQNARLAARLTGWKIDIRSDKQN